MISKSEAGKLGQLAALQTQKLQFEKRLIEYGDNPKLCKHCNHPIAYEKQTNKYCSSSCSASATNYTKKRKSDIFCINCNRLITTRNASTYCSYKCQQSYSRRIKIEKETASSKTMKAYLLEHHGNVCMDIECAWDFSKRPIKVELEHKDGNSENNIIKNCILLCPNCHSLTDTYKNKNKGNGRHTRRQRYADGKSH